MKRIDSIICLAVIICSLVPQFMHAQAYIGFSNYAGGSGNEEVLTSQVINGETYVVGTTTSANFPVTNGTVYSGGTDLTIAKYDVNGNVIYSTFLGGLGNETFATLKIVNGEVYINGSTDSINFPVTNNSVFHGGKDLFITKLTSNGNIGFSTYLGGNKNESAPFLSLEIVGNEIFIAGTTASPDFPVTNSSVYAGGVSDIFFTKLNATDGVILSSKLWGGNKQEYATQMLFENGFLYVLGVTFSNNIPVTIGSTLNDVYENNFVIKASAIDLNINYSRYLGGNGRDFMTKGIVINGILHLTGYTYSTDFPVTNNSTPSGASSDISDGFFTKLNTNGSIIFSTYLSTNDPDQINAMVISNGDVYLTGSTTSLSNGEKNILIFKLDANGNFVYTKRFYIQAAAPSPPTYLVINGELYFSLISQSAAYPVTDNSQFYDPGSGVFTHLDALGNIIFSTFLGKMSSLLQMQFENNRFYILGNSPFPSYPVTGMTTFSGVSDNILIILDEDGSNVFGGYVGGYSGDVASTMRVSNTNIYFAGKTYSSDYPVTSSILYKGLGDQFITKISLCPGNYLLTNDSLSPKTQTVCKFGLAQKITGVEINVPADSLPMLYRNGIQSPQEPIKTNYQWQSANSLTGTWTDIPTAAFKDYRPILGGISQYYRRLTYTLPDCGSTLIHISDTAVAVVNLLTAPTIEAGGPFITCPGIEITLGGSPTASGGNPPYTSYSWDMNADLVPNPVVSPEVSTIYTLTVTDSLGCQQIDQAEVLTYRADAGFDKGACAGIAAKIGTPAITGLSGILYSWNPGTGLTSTSIAQPFANPAITTAYALTLTIPRTGGGTCETNDTVRVTPVAAPLTPDFAGSDKVICLNDSVSLGTAPEPGFEYTWSPGSYLTDNASSSVYYYPGNVSMPVPNPTTLYLTARKDGCSFSDETHVATIEARADLDGCGPRLVGKPDRTPFINETYLWTKISGSGNFTGPTNLPQVPVSASTGESTTYQLTVTYNDHSCTDEVVVAPSCIGCWAIIDVSATYLCPDYDVNGGDVTLIASSSLTNAVFTWEPHQGLSDYTGSVVHLTDNVPRMYTVTATDANDSLIHCSYDTLVNDPAFSRPVFPAPDTITCAGVPVTIGLAPVAGYTYEWSGNGLSSTLISNPVATVNTETAFPVIVRDGNGCELKDTIVVAVQNIHANAGPDWIICSNGVVNLGTPLQPNTSYLWEPEDAPWQNGTSEFSAQPEVFVATDLSFVLTATTSAGCISRDTALISINNIPSIPNAFDKFICIHGSITIGSPALPGVIYQWTPVEGLNNPNIAQPIASPLVTTIYTVLATFPGSCAGSASDQVTVTVGNAFFDLPNISFCPENGPVALGNGAPANMLSYTWQPQQLVTNSSIANPSTLNPPPNSPTVFTLLAVNMYGCSYRDTIRIIPVITPALAGPDKSICQGQATTIGSAANITGPTITYSWIPATNLSDPSSPNPIFTGVSGGTFVYVLTKTDNTAACSSLDTVIIRVDSLLPVFNPVTVCQNSCVQIGTAPVTGVQYQWSPITGLSNANISNPIACINTTPVIYTLTGTNLNGCMASSIIPVNVNPVAAPQIVIPVVNACLGDTNVIFNPLITPAGNYSYSWSPDNGTLSDIYSLSPHIMITGTGNFQYLLQVIDTNTACPNIAIGNLVVNICPSLAVIGDYLWFDTNTNGIQDAGELGVSGMTVRLYNNTGVNIASTITDGNGIYHFTDVEPGNGYYVRFSKPDGYDFTTRDVGGIGTGDNSEANDNGRSHNFNVPAGANIAYIDAGIKPGCGTVPVTLLSFNADLHNTEVFLNWQTTAEYNNHYFDVERSNDSRNFTAIGRVNGNGTTVLPHNYSLIDPDPVQGMNYYRLKQVDFDAHVIYSQIVPIRLSKTGAITAYYNNNSIQVNFNEPQDNSTIKLYGANGQLIRSAHTAKNIMHYSFELPPLAKGIYMLQIRNDKLTWGRKIFIE